MPPVRRAVRGGWTARQALPIVRRVRTKGHQGGTIKVMPNAIFGAVRAMGLIAAALCASLIGAMPVPAEGAMPRQCPRTPHGPTLAEGPISCSCSAGATASGTIWGTETYTEDSTICRAALHAGAIPAEGGTVTLMRAPSQAAYRASTQHGVESEEYGAWPSSFRFARPGELTAEQLAVAAARCPATVASDQVGPETLTCSCAATSGPPPGPVWGTLVYTTDSALCAAAVHAGAVDRRGGAITVVMMPGRRAYRGSLRNGITSQGYREWPSSFRFAGLAPPDLSICPETVAEREDEKDGPLTCTCPAEQTLRGAVWGTGVYTSDSAICVAAVHAGAITRAGGQVTVVPAPAETTYSSSLRNGIQSGAWQDTWDASIRFEGIATSPTASPVQSPVGHTLRTLGQVSLYIQFRTNSAELDPSALPTLNELRDALHGDAGLRLRIVGHTDNTGGASSNGPLSQRRADAVRTWLVSQGIDAGRLRAEGRGQDQPVADNSTEVGRALNRRVQVVRIE